MKRVSLPPEIRGNRRWIEGILSHQAALLMFVQKEHR
jgi:hypothetical protein